MGKYYVDDDPNKLPSPDGQQAADFGAPLTTNLDLEGGGYVQFDRGKDKEGDSITKFIPDTGVQPAGSTPLPPSIKAKHRFDKNLADALHSPIKKRFSGLSGFGGEVVSVC